MSGFIQLLRVHGHAHAQSETFSNFVVVRYSSDAFVVNFTLLWRSVSSVSGM